MLMFHRTEQRCGFFQAFNVSEGEGNAAKVK